MDFVYICTDKYKKLLQHERQLRHPIDSDGTLQYCDLPSRKLNGKPRKGIYIDNGIKKISRYIR